MLQLMKSRILLFLKGMAMGAADVVPGVSGGTMAFITNIYEEFIEALRNIDLTAIKMLFKGQWKALVEKINLAFLMILLAGILTAAFTLAKLVLFFLENYPIWIWSFFFGLILASSLVVSKKVRQWGYTTVLFVIIGTVIAYFVTESSIIQMPDTPFYIFLAGVISIMAMILPGISGSFLLVILNKYELIIKAMSSFGDFVKNGLPALLQGQWNTVKTAFSNVDFMVMVFFYIGTLTGLLSFSKVLSWLFRKYHDLTVAVLTGFLLGSLNKVWPWKVTISYYTDRHGEKKPLEQDNVLPTSFDSEVFIALGLMVIGFFLVYAIGQASNESNENDTKR